MRLIDADAVAEAINDEIEITAEIGTHEADVCKGGLIMGLAYVNTAPTIDAVPVVRCKDCSFWHGNTQYCGKFSIPNWAQRTPPDCFCALGERKDNE